MGSADAPGSTDRALVRRMWREARGHRRWVVLLTVLEGLTTPLYLLAPVPLKLAIDSVIGDAEMPGVLEAVLPGGADASTHAKLLLVAGLQVAVILAIQALLAATQVLQSRTGERLTLTLRQKLFRHIQRMSFQFVDSRGTADSVYRVQYDTPSLRNAALYGLIPMIGAAFTLVAMVVVITGIDARMAVVGLLVVPVLVVMMRAYKIRMRPAYKEAKNLETSALHVVQETLGAFRVVKVFGREEEHSRRFEDRSDKSIRALVKLAFAEGVFGLATQVTIGVATAVVLYLGARATIAGRLTVGDLTLVMAYLAQMLAPIKTISKVSATLQNHLASAQRVFEVLDLRPDVQDRPDAIGVDRAEGHVRVEQVTFGYEDEPVLQGVDLDVAAGTRVGVFGPTGAGKTTLIGLLLRVHDPDRGMVSLDGTDLRDIKLADLREQFSVVMQDSVLFSASIAENIAYGRPGASHDDVVAAAKAAGAHNFVTDLPDGYETLVGERGMRMSGGERQRIAIARAFLKDAPVLVLDEPTSAVDQQTEAAIMAAMERLMTGRTTFMIAHRLSTLDVCDVFVEVREGSAEVVGRDVLRARKGGAPSPAAPTEPAIDDGELLGHLREVLIDEVEEPQRLRVVQRQLDLYAHRTRTEIVQLQQDTAPGLRHVWVRCSYYHVEGDGRGEPYEAHVHRTLLAGTDLPVPRLLGTFTPGGGGVTCVVTEHLPLGWRLDQLATEEAMLAAARWLAEFHRRHHVDRVQDLPEIRRRRVAHYTDAVPLAADGLGLPREELHRMAAPYLRQVEELLDFPLTCVVGDAYPTNLMIAGGRLMPLDFSEVTVAAGECDLAQLIDGWPAPTAHACIDTYQRARWPDGVADPTDREAVARRLRLARIDTHLQAIAGGDEGSWRWDELRKQLSTIGSTA